MLLVFWRNAKYLPTTKILRCTWQYITNNFKINNRKVSLLKETEKLLFPEYLNLGNNSAQICVWNSIKFNWCKKDASIQSFVEENYYFLLILGQ